MALFVEFTAFLVSSRALLTVDFTFYCLQVLWEEEAEAEEVKKILHSSFISLHSTSISLHSPSISQVTFDNFSGDF